ncbi:hypothetical protein MMU07_07220 [Aquiflexum sp. LQ15W]|uniref:hypothetical protein n=1 Tax=Cognataquiflexum nitidum TaxID=2922272 RepID=UPI001F129449|nr:hypothetical protein [Cognataquiflexum nitidum]MCH6199361.1 hypothetical protein [Cognataquiflexum nitidum]
MKTSKVVRREMRNLTAIELQAIKNSIVRKEISSAEILMEVYDHYVSHLQEFGEVDFDDQLAELEEKFTYGYCHALQAKFNKEIRKEIGALQWKVVKKNFCLSRILYVLGFMMIAFYLGSNVKNEKEGAILMVTPLLILTVFHIYFLFKSSSRIKKIKESISQTSPLQSSLFYPFSERMYLPVVMAYSLVWFADLMFEVKVLSNIAPQIAATFSILLFIYVISLMEVWKIKSKKSLI